MNKNKELVKNTAIISIGKICTQFLSFLLLPLYTAILSTQDYGSVDLITTYQQLIGYIAFFQIEQAVFRFLIDARKEKEEQNRIITSVFGFAIIQAMTLGIVMFLVSRFISIQYFKELYLYCIAVVFSGLMLQVSRGLGNNLFYAVGSFISAISTIIFNIVFLVALRLGAVGMLYSFILGNSICFVFLFLKERIYKYISVSNFSVADVKKYLKYSVPLVPNALSWWVMGASDRTIVSYILGTTSNGFLSVSHKFSSAYTAFYTVFNLSWTESASLHFNDEDHEHFFSSVILRVYKLFFAACLGIIAIMPFVFPILINSSYADAYYQIPIYMVAAFFNVIQGLYSVIYVALKKTKEIAKTTVVSALINIVVNIALIGTVGLYAASISSLVAYAVNCIWRYFDLKKYMNVPLNKKLVMSSIIIVVAVCVPYYLNIFALQVSAMLLTVIYCLYINRDIIMTLLKNPKDIKNQLITK